MARAKRVMWFGFDGASRGFVDRFISEGKMPVLARLMREGVFSESLPVPPCDTPTNWAALQTGAHPGTTEVVSFFTHRPGEPLDIAHNTLHSGALKAESVWEALERQGRVPIVINWPCSWPSRLQHGIQIGGTGPLTTSWRIGYGRAFHFGESGSRILDPALKKQFGGLSEALELSPAEWRAMPPSRRPPLEATFNLLGREALEWSETGMRVSEGGGPDVSGGVIHMLMLADTDAGYDRILLARDRDADGALELRPGAWSGWIRESFPRDALLDQLVPEVNDLIEGLFQWKLLALESDGSRVSLYRTDIWQEDGWSYPPEVASQLADAVGPFTEGLELTPPTARLFDEWETYRQQLDQTRSWYVGAAKYLALKGDWDLLAMQLHIQDGINHIVARDICPDDSRYDAGRAAVAWEQIEAAYTTMDQIVGEVVAALGDEDTAVCVVSDHGALPTFRQCLVSGALARAGLMAYLHDEASGRWNVDWSRTKVFPRRGQLWVNRVGRDPDGIVRDEDYEQVRTEAIRALLSIWDDEHKSQPVVAALRKEDAVNYGIWGDKVGDIITFLAPLYADSDTNYASLQEDPLATPDTGPTDLGCAHHPYLPSATYGIWGIPAIFLLSGPGVRRDYVRSHPISQVDVAPTICHLLGIAPPAHCEGKVVIDVLVPQAADNTG